MKKLVKTRILALILRTYFELYINHLFYWDLLTTYIKKFRGRSYLRDWSYESDKALLQKPLEARNNLPGEEKINLILL